MRKFEVGKRYKESDSRVYEVIKRTAKFVTIIEIHHEGRFNERRLEEKKYKVHDWDTREVFLTNLDTVEA